jgi:cell pole-organizing protein PopZ
MNMTEKNGQPSMEEILASIRRIIAEEPQPHNGELRGTPIMLKGDGVLDDAGDFDLPAIFRSSPPPQADRQTPLLGRLTDAIRSATSAQPEAPAPMNGSAYSYGEPADSGAPGHLNGDAYPALSSLKAARPDAHAEHHHVNGSSLKTDPAPASGGAFPAVSAAPSSAGEPKRVMAAFKDTHFMRMTGPAGAEASAPAVVEPVPVAPAPVAPVVEAATGPDFSAIIPGQMDRAGLLNGSHSAQPPFVINEPVAPSVIGMPPPPLPPVEATHNALTVIPNAAGEQTGTIEDTTADLLRPMLRAWLADNMPRMVEKALHIEIAESVRAPKKP